MKDINYSEDAVIINPELLQCINSRDIRVDEGRRWAFSFRVGGHIFSFPIPENEWGFYIKWSKLRFKHAECLQEIIIEIELRSWDVLEYSASYSETDNLLVAFEEFADRIWEIIDKYIYEIDFTLMNFSWVREENIGYSKIWNKFFLKSKSEVVHISFLPNGFDKIEKNIIMLSDWTELYTITNNGFTYLVNTKNLEIYNSFESYE